MEIENIKNENVGVWLEENIVHIQNNNELIYTHGGPSITIYIDNEVIEDIANKYINGTMG